MVRKIRYNIIPIYFITLLVIIYKLKSIFQLSFELINTIVF